MRLPFLFILVYSCASSFLPAQTTSLTETQREEIKARLEKLQEAIENQSFESSHSAGATFLQAASSPSAALDLYLKCIKLVNFDRQNRPDIDYRTWKEKSENELKDKEFAQALMVQLSYLGMTCKIADLEDLEPVYGTLMSHVSRLSSSPLASHKVLKQPVSNSIFAKAYGVDSIIGKIENWELSPGNIDGIYTQTIFPYLREERPDALLSMWDQRIEFHRRQARATQDNRDEMLRGKRAAEEVNVRNKLAKSEGKYGEVEFVETTLPNLEWGKLKDHFKYVNAESGARAMEAFIAKHIRHKATPGRIQEMLGLLTPAPAPEEAQTEAETGLVESP